MYYFPKGNLHIRDLKDKVEKYKQLTSNEFDLRTKVQIYEDLRKKNNKVSLVLSPKSLIDKNSNLDFLILSGISNIKTISCNENGYYQIYQSDRYGFNNPDEEWKNEKVKYLLLGDSFVQGSCVNRPNDIASSLRNLTKKTSINLGYSGNGPLFQLATLREYMPKNVENIIWFYYEENDLIDLSKEMKNSILLKYLNNNKFSQNLKENQNKIDKYLASNINKNLDTINSEEEYWKKYYSKKKVFLRFIRLDNFKNFIKFLKKNKTVDNKDDMIKNLEKILLSAKETAGLNNSNLYFVYLSGYHRYSSFLSNQYEFMNNYPKIISMVNNLGIPVIDLHADFLIREKYPLEYFPFSKYGHYNIKGYKKISEIIYELIK